MDQDYTFGLREFFASQANHWFFFVAVLFFSAEWNFQPGAGDILAWVFLGFLPPALYLVRRKKKRFLTVLLCHILAIAAVLLLPLSFFGLRILYLVFAMGYVLVSVLHYLQPKEMPTRIVPPYVSMVLCFLVPFFLSFQREKLYVFPYCLVMILQAGMYFLAFFTDKFLVFTSLNTGTASSMPKREIFASGIRSAFIFVLSVSGLLFLISLLTVPKEWFQRFQDWVREGLRELFQFLFGWIGRLQRDSSPKQEFSDGISGAAQLPAQAETAVVWLILEKVFILLMVIGLIAFTVYVLVRILRQLRGITVVSKPEEDLPEEKDIHEKLLAEPVRIASAQEEGWLSPRQKIRRLYKKKLLESGDENVRLISLTAREFALAQDNPMLGEIYEKARYSQEPCDKQDVRRMHLACRRKKR